MVDADVVGDIDASELGKEKKNIFYYHETEKYGIILTTSYSPESVETVNPDSSYGEKMVSETKFSPFITNAGIC